jgi:hypothetical protein
VPHEIGGPGQVTGRAQLDTRHGRSGAPKRLEQLVRRPGETLQLRNELRPDPPERRGHGARRAPLLPLTHEPRDVAGRVDRVGDGDHERRPGAGVDRTADGVGRPKRLRLLGEADVEPVEQAPDLIAEVADDDRHGIEAGSMKLAEERHDHGLPVDREDRLRPTLGQRAQAEAFARGHDDRLHYGEPRPSDRSERRPRSRSPIPSRRRIRRRMERSSLFARTAASAAPAAGP